jgi:peptide/nickel transport system permease protein
VLLVIAAVAGVGDLLVRFDPQATALSVASRPPLGLGPTALPEHWLGTDAVGRDILSRLIAGTRVSVLTAALSVGGAMLMGTAAGILGGYVGGWADRLLMRLADATLAFPAVLLALLLAVRFGPSFWGTVGVLCILLWARFARVVRAEVLALREREFIAAARVVGGGPLWIMWRHVLPNVAGTVLVLVTLQIGWAIIAEASLSFLGAGVPPPAPAWGTMVADGRNVLRSAWWISSIPGLAIMLLVVACNSVGDWLRDVLDPRLRTH